MIRSLHATDIRISHLTRQHPWGRGGCKVEGTTPLMWSSSDGDWSGLVSTIEAQKFAAGSATPVPTLARLRCFLSKPERFAWVGSALVPASDDPTRFRYMALRRSSGGREERVGDDRHRGQDPLDADRRNRINRSVRMLTFVLFLTVKCTCKHRSSALLSCT